MTKAKAKTKTETLTVLCYFIEDLNNLQKVFNIFIDIIWCIVFSRVVLDRHLDLTDREFQDDSEERTEINTVEISDGWRINRGYILKKLNTNNLIMDDLDLIYLNKYKEEA